MNFPEIRSEEALNQVLVDNLFRICCISTVALAVIGWRVYLHEFEPAHWGVEAMIHEEIETAGQKDDVKAWYSELSGIKRREERARLGEMTFTEQDEIDRQVYTTLMLETCQSLMEKGVETCEKLQVVRVLN